MTIPEPLLWSGEDFVGAKAAFLIGTRLLCYLRDDRPDLPWPGRWDLPGGGREGGESPADCLLRELEEEFGLALPPGRLSVALRMPAMRGVGQAWFFAGRLEAAELAQVRFGDEGQCWRAMEVAEFLSHPRAIPPLQDRVRQVLPLLG